MALLPLAACLIGYPGMEDDFKEGGGLPSMTELTG